MWLVCVFLSLLAKAGQTLFVLIILYIVLTSFDLPFCAVKMYGIYAQQTSRNVNTVLFIDNSSKIY